MLVGVAVCGVRTAMAHCCSAACCCYTTAELQNSTIWTGDGEQLPLLRSPLHTLTYSVLAAAGFASSTTCHQRQVVAEYCCPRTRARTSAIWSHKIPTAERKFFQHSNRCTCVSRLWITGTTRVQQRYPAASHVVIVGPSRTHLHPAKLHHEHHQPSPTTDLYRRAAYTHQRP